MMRLLLTWLNPFYWLDDRISPRYRGMYTLFKKELLRFWRVAFQTIASPILTALLYLLIFSHVLESHVKVYDQVSYTAFLVLD